LNEAREDASRALQLAGETAFLEAKWRTFGTMARIEEAAEPENLALIENWLREAVRVLEQLRSDWKQAGVADTLLENDEVLRVYAQLARTLSKSDPDALSAFLEQTGWPPLAALTDEKPGDL
jgi:hypothetical protein